MSDKSLVFCTDNILTWLWKVLYTFPAEHFEEKLNFQKQFLFFLSFSHTERNFLGFISNFFQPGCQNCILRVYRFNLSRKFFVKIYSLIIFEHRSGESSRPSGIHFSRGLSKLHSTCLLKTLVETFLGERRNIFITVFGQGVELFWLLSKFFQQARQTCFLIYQKKTLAKNSCLKKWRFLIILENWAKLFRFCGKFNGRFVTVAFCLSIRIFWEVFLGRFHRSFLSFSDFEHFFSAFCQASSHGDDKMAFYVYRRKIWE